MIKLEQLQANAALRGIVPDALVTVVSVQWFGSEALELTYTSGLGMSGDNLLRQSRSGTWHSDNKNRLD